MPCDKREGPDYTNYKFLYIEFRPSIYKKLATRILVCVSGGSCEPLPHMHARGQDEVVQKRNVLLCMYVLPYMQLSKSCLVHPSQSSSDCRGAINNKARHDRFRHIIV